ncbi:MAG: hypothetical protein K2H64_02975 [Desulfovibrio sp.]|nr:hypothetical protein [Desulfovibrio sp.]
MAGHPGKYARGKDTEGKQATPDADKPGIQDQVDMTNPDALQPPELREEPVIRAQIEFNDQTTRAAVTFFKSANLASAPHELFHIFRRELEATANSAKGSARAKEQWRRLQEQMGGRDGEAWTVAMEEEFANMGLRYLAEGKAPMPGLQGVFEAFRRWLMDIYKSYDRIGGEISPEMRQIFDAMFYVPYDVADRQFRYALGEQYLRRPEEEFADPASVGERLAPEDEKAIQAEKSGDEKLATELAEDARAQGEEAAARLERDDPELARKELAEERQELAEIEKAEQRLDDWSELREQALECRVNGG